MIVVRHEGGGIVGIFDSWSAAETALNTYFKDLDWHDTVPGRLVTCVTQSGTLFLLMKIEPNKLHL